MPKEKPTPIWEMEPKTISQAIRLLQIALYDQDHFREHLNSSETADEFYTPIHHAAGRTMRNRWGLWRGLMHNQEQEGSDGNVPDPSPLHDHIAITTGITHPDDQSSFIFRLLYEKEKTDRTFGEVAWDCMTRYHDHWTTKYDAPEWAPLNNIKGQ